jgi:hypothetical protein
MSAQMNSLLEGLRRHLAVRNHEYIDNPSVIGSPVSMENAVESIKKKVGEKQGKPAADRIQDALTILFEKGPEIALRTHLRYICWGLLEPWGNTHKKVLTEPVLFNKTISEIEALKSSEISMSAWRGLLAAYFGWAPDRVTPAGFKNWQELRRLLSKRFDIKKNKPDVFRPVWLHVLSEHANLLSENPCDRYGSSLFSDDESLLKPLREELRIPPSSWFWSELFLSQIKAAIEKNDDVFLNLLDNLLPQIVNFSFSANDALKMILERYQQSRQRITPHSALSEEVIKAWGSPHLERNARWGLVKTEAKSMVQNWLVVKALDDFFRLLQEDNAADERRLNFWLRYQQSIDYFHFALGPGANDNRQKDYQSFRTRFRDHICKLSSPGKRENNAFILKLGDFWVVEFGAIGNACYMYEKNGIPFDIGTNWLDLNFLKDRKKAIFRLSHMSGWEWEFEQKLKEIGIHPDNDKQLLKKEIRMPHSKFGQHVTQPRTSNLNSFLAAGMRIAEDYRLETQDELAKGGAFWVLWKNDKGLIADKLRHCGFKYYQSRGWWKK